jgi:hypothetical protein
LPVRDSPQAGCTLQRQQRQPPPADTRSQSGTSGHPGSLASQGQYRRAPTNLGNDPFSDAHQEMVSERCRRGGQGVRPGPEPLAWVIEEVVPDGSWERVAPLLPPPKRRRTHCPGRRPTMTVPRPATPSAPPTPPPCSARRSDPYAPVWGTVMLVRSHSARGSFRPVTTDGNKRNLRRTGWEFAPSGRNISARLDHVGG